MHYKDVFLNSLSDEQLGFFCAHEYDANLKDLLQDQINALQYKLFIEWKKYEAEQASSTLNSDSVKLDTLLSKIDTLTSLFTSLTTRVVDIESRITSNSTQIKQNQEIEESTISTELKAMRKAMDNQFSAISNKIEVLDEHFKQKLSQIKAEQKSNIQATLQHSNTLKEMDEKFSAVFKKIEEIDDQTVQLCLSTLSFFDSEKLCKKWLQNLLSQVNDSTIAKETREEIGSKENIEKIVTIMKKYAGNDEIEIMASSLLMKLSSISFSICINIVESGCAEYFKDLIITYWPKRNTKETTLNNFYLVFVNITCFTETRHHLLKDCYFQLFQLPLFDTEFSKYSILAGNLVCYLSCIADNKWKTRLTREEAENTLIKNMTSWQLGKFSPLNFSTSDFALTYISTGTNAQKRFWAWVIANVLMVEPAKYVDILKKEEGVAKMEAILADRTIDVEVRKLVQISIDILKTRTRYDRPSWGAAHPKHPLLLLKN